MRNLNSAQVSYSSTSGVYASLAGLQAAQLIDNRYTSSNFSGFVYTVGLTPDARHYTIYATAVSANTSRYDYYTLPDFVVRFSTAASRAPAGMTGQPVQ
jgi:hypothetical protein